MNGDASLLMAEHPAHSFDTLFLDWPYSNMTPVRGKDVGAAGRIYGPISFIFEILTHANRLATKGAHLYLFTDWRGIPDMGYLLSVTGWFPTTIISWDKRYTGTGGVWRSSWEPIFFATKGPADRRCVNAHRNVITVPSVRGRGRHPAQKPTELWDGLCKPSVVPGTRVLDPFAGSGSSQVPVERCGGRWWGADIDSKWIRNEEKNHEE